MTNHYDKIRSLDGKFKDTHRALMELCLGRSLDPKEWVHHKNEDKHDNRIDNLEIVSPGKHMELHGQLGFRAKRFSRSEINKILAEALESPLSYRALARKYQTSKSTIHRIKSGQY